MGCDSCYNTKEDKEEKNKIRNNIKKTDYYENDNLSNLLSNYIEFYKAFYKKNYKGKIYLAETTFFKDLFVTLNIDLKNENSDLNKLKNNPIKIEKKQISLVNYKDDLTNLKNSNIEILNKELFGMFGNKGRRI